MSVTGLHDSDIRLDAAWQLTQAADGGAPLCSGLDCLYQNIVLEALTQPGICSMTRISDGGFMTSSSQRTAP